MIPANRFLNLPPHEVSPHAEEEFFSSLRLRNGTYKTTYEKRFAEVDRELQKLIKQGDMDVGSVLDIGISSGVCTLELHQALSSVGRECQITGIDLAVDAALVRVLPGCFALMDETGYPLRYDILGWSMKPWVVREDYWTGFFVPRKCVNLLFGYRARKMMESPSSPATQKVELVTPRLRNLPNVRVEKSDITKYNNEFSGRFSLIRAANVLNKGYFGDKELALVVGNIKRYLVKPKAFFLVIRTHQNGVNHGSLFSVDNAGCSVLRRFGKGSEIEDIVLTSMRGDS
ncbi:MAG: ATP/GTP-binding protein [Rhodanobacteraceae bacterium]